MSELQNAKVFVAVVAVVYVVVMLYMGFSSERVDIYYGGYLQGVAGGVLCIILSRLYSDELDYLGNRVGFIYGLIRSVSRFLSGKK